MHRVLTFLVISISAMAAGRTTISFDSGWRFLKADAPGAERPEFDDASWRKVDVPHDWSIEGPFDRNNPTGGAGAFLPAGVGWYRRHFTLNPALAGQPVFVEFDGVMGNSEVWINGFRLGKRPYGYVSFAYEMTDHLNFGNQDNVLAVKADNSLQPASRWYAGAGIYRHVRLVAQGAVHVERWSTFVTSPQVAEDQATVRVQSTVVNESSAPRTVTVRIAIMGGLGTGSDLLTIPAGKSVSFAQEFGVNRPYIWNLDHPELYHASVQVQDEQGATLDTETVSFGIREFHFDAATGFWLNGKNLKIKGVCLHQDGGAVGAAVPLSVWERRLAMLKELGVNAIRTAHNPPAPEFLELCDRMGLLVMDELFDCWTVGKNPYDYHLYFRDWSRQDTEDTVRRDRNHPSVILYSAGNEIRDTPNAELAKGILRGLLDVFHANDPTRPVTQALFRPNASHDYDDGLADMLDVIGQNYREGEILAAHAQKPSRKIIGTENQQGRLAWLALRDNPPFAGQFLWSGIDYLGESRSWPAVASSPPRQMARHRQPAPAHQRPDRPGHQARQQDLGLFRPARPRRDDGGLRVDRQLEEALATGADPLHLAATFGLDPGAAPSRYASSARQLLQTAAEQQDPAPVPREPKDRIRSTETCRFRRKTFSPAELGERSTPGRT